MLLFNNFTFVNEQQRARVNSHDVLGSEPLLQDSQFVQVQFQQFFSHCFSVAETKSKRVVDLRICQAFTVIFLFNDESVFGVRVDLYKIFER